MENAQLPTLLPLATESGEVDVWVVRSQHLVLTTSRCDLLSGVHRLRPNTEEFRAAASLPKNTPHPHEIFLMGMCCTVDNCQQDIEPARMLHFCT
jgi:hypothetical protein